MKNVSITENGAIGLNTTSNALVDLNFATGSLRGKPDKAKQMFAKAYAENPMLAMKWLFYCRDVRGGMGERSISRNIMAWLQWKHPEVMNKVIDLLPEYGRWDDVVYLMEFSSTRDQAVRVIGAQLSKDIKAYRSGQNVSLLGKWLPSLSASSKTSRMRAYDLASRLGMSPEVYRKTCSTLREQANVLERKLTDNKWSHVDYSAVPSQANLKYSKAFRRHDGERYSKYLESVNNGEIKMNASVLMPYEIVHKYTHGHHRVFGGVSPELEGLWKNLPDMDCNGMVMLDGSGSMSQTIGKSTVTAHDVADSLAVYFSQMTKGPLHGKFLTFGHQPDFVDISGCETLYRCLEVLSEHTDCSNTDLYRAYKLLADVAVKYGFKQEDIPERIIIVSDMEFDGCCGKYNDAGRRGYYAYDGFSMADKTLFDEIKSYWKAAGYEMPHLVFWNVNSRTNTVPVAVNKLGVTLVSGFSTQVIKMVMTDQLDPFYALYEVLSADRYKAVEEHLMKA